MAKMVGSEEFQSDPEAACYSDRILTCTTTRNGVAHMPQADAKSTASLVPGSTLSAPYPFVREVSDWGETEGALCWKCGTRCDGKGEFTDYSADAMGQIQLTVVSVHRPWKYPTRVFFTRQWIDPDGKRFGKKKLRMTTVNAFLALAKGYRHDFELVKVTT